MEIHTSRHFLAKLAARRASRLLSMSIFLSAAALSVAPHAHAASGNWLGTTDTTWMTDTNWSSGAHPVSGDTATFNAAAATVNNFTTIDLGTGQAANTVVFDTANAAAYTIGAGAVNSQTLTLDTTGAITMNSTVVNNELFDAAIVLGTAGAGAAAGTTTITNASTTNSLTFAGALTGGTGGTAGAKTVNTAGAGAINFTGGFAAGGATSISLTNISTGNTTLTGTGTDAFSTFRATANGTVTVNGPTVTVAASSAFGSSSTTFGKFVLTSGSAAFNGGITSGNTADQILYQVNGGTFTASTVSIGRNQSFTTLPTASSTTSGFIVNGGTANVTGALTLGTSNSSASALVNGGALTVGGAINIGNTTNTRYSVLEVRSGSLTSTDTTNGVVLSLNTTSANNTELLLTGGTSSVQRIAFGAAAATAGSTGTVTLNGAAAALYLGSGGLVLGSANTYTATTNLTAGTLGATADWSSSLAVNLGTNPTIQAADTVGVAHNITLTGFLGGGAFTKTGGGTLTLTAANGYTGVTTVNAGTLNINGVNALGGANYAGLTLNGGTLQYNTASSTANNGSLDVSNIGGTAKPLTIGAAGATIDTNGNTVTFANTIGNSGTGALTKVGTGILTLAAANTYTGGTNVNAGTLTISLNGGLSSGTTTVAAGAILELSTGVTAAHSVTTATLTLAGTTSTVMLDAAAGTVQDSVGTLIVNGVREPNGTYGGTGSTARTILPEFTGTGVLAVVPEPSTWALLSGGLVGLAALSRRRRRCV